MRTIDILQKLVDSIKQNPGIISQLPLNDLRLCIYTEIDYCSSLYSPEYLQKVKQLFSDTFTEMERSIACFDSYGVIRNLEKIIWGIQILPNWKYFDTIIQQAEFDHACLNHYKNDTIIVLGDSHVNFFSGNEELSFHPIGHGINVCKNRHDYPFTVLHLGPCLAYTCNKTDSAFRFKEKADYLCEHFIKPSAKVICSLGEIDLRVHVSRQEDLQNRPYQEIVDDILAEYMTFLKSLQARGYTVYCWGPIASQTENCPVDSNFPRSGSEIYRNKATAYFTEQLQQLCQQHNIGFLSIFDKMITEDYRTLEQYISSDRCHLGQNALPLALAEWKKYFDL